MPSGVQVGVGLGVGVQRGTVGVGVWKKKPCPLIGTHVGEGVGVLKCCTPVVGVAVGPWGGGVVPPPPWNSSSKPTIIMIETSPEPMDSQVILLLNTDFNLVPSEWFDGARRALLRAVWPFLRDGE